MLEHPVYLSPLQTLSLLLKLVFEGCQPGALREEKETISHPDT